MRESNSIIFYSILEPVLNMESILSEGLVKIDYVNLTIGHLCVGPKLFSEIEGHLIIEVNDKVVFSEEGILLLELAKDIDDWLWLDTSFSDFEYYSMDYDEEGPILNFKKQESEWEITSIWLPELCAAVSETDLISTCKFFISKLLDELKNKAVDYEVAFKIQ